MQAEKSEENEEDAAKKNMASAEEMAAADLAKENEIVEAARQAYRKALAQADAAKVRMLCAYVLICTYTYRPARMRTCILRKGKNYALHICSKTMALWTYEEAECAGVGRCGRS